MYASFLGIFNCLVRAARTLLNAGYHKLTVLSHPFISFGYCNFIIRSLVYGEHYIIVIFFKVLHILYGIGKHENKSTLFFSELFLNLFYDRCGENIKFAVSSKVKFDEFICSYKFLYSDIKFSLKLCDRGQISVPEKRYTVYVHFPLLKQKVRTTEVIRTEKAFPSNVATQSFSSINRTRKKGNTFYQG